MQKIGLMSLFLALIFSANAGTALSEPISVPRSRNVLADFSELIERVSPAVVSVQVTNNVADTSNGLSEQLRQMPEFESLVPELEEFMRRRNRSLPTPRQTRSAGSGFFISANGHIVTNGHVIGDGGKIMVKLHDGRELPAQTVGVDEQTDLAVLKVSLPEPAPYVAFANDAKPRVGEWVVAVGNPFNFGGTATVGIVSALGREIGRTYADFIQIDASINHGNSGGPTFNTKGQVIGVNTAIVSPSGGSVGIGFAIEAGVASRIVKNLIENGEVIRGWLGVSIQSINKEIAKAREIKFDYGAIVSEVMPGSPAEQGGFRRGDVIIAINGKETRDAREVTRQVGVMKPGQRTRFTIARNKRTLTLRVKIGTRPKNSASSTTPNTMLMGVNTKPPSGYDRQRLSLRKDEQGLIISEMALDSPFHAVGISVGDALLEANGLALGSEQDLRLAINNARRDGKEHLLVAVRKANRTVFLPVRLE